MTRQHFKPQYPAETFGVADINTVLDEGQRSKSNEHTDRLQHGEIFQKTEKNEERKR